MEAVPTLLSRQAEPGLPASQIRCQPSKESQVSQMHRPLYLELRLGLRCLTPLSTPPLFWCGGLPRGPLSPCDRQPGVVYCKNELRIGSRPGDLPPLSMGNHCQE